MATNPEKRGHEARDASAKWIFAMVGLLFVVLIGVHYGMDGMLRSLKHTPAPTDRWRPVARAPGSAPRLPPPPRLQISAPADLRAFRAREEAQLNSYGWINKTSGVVRIPIEVAMELVLKEGLPVRSSTNASQAGPSPYQLIQQRP